MRQVYEFSIGRFLSEWLRLRTIGIPILIETLHLIYSYNILLFCVCTCTCIHVHIVFASITISPYFYGVGHYQELLSEQLRVPLGFLLGIVFYVIVVTHARVPHGIYWLSSDVGPQASRANGTTEPIYPIHMSARVLCVTTDLLHPVYPYMVKNQIYLATSPATSASKYNYILMQRTKLTYMYNVLSCVHRGCDR